MTNTQRPIRSENLVVRLARKDMQLVEKAARQSGVTVSDFVRALVLPTAHELVGHEAGIHGIYLGERECQLRDLARRTQIAGDTGSPGQL